MVSRCNGYTHLRVLVGWITPHSDVLDKLKVAVGEERDGEGGMDEMKEGGWER